MQHRDTLAKGRGGRSARFGLDARLLILGALAVGGPVMTAMTGSHDGRLAIATGLGVLGAAVLAATGWMLPSLRAAARELRARSGEDVASGAVDPQLMLSQLRTLGGRLDALQHALGHTHPLTGLPTREAFAGTLAKHLAEPGACGVVGIVRLGDYDELAAFDAPAADRSLVSFAERLQASLARGRLVAQIDRDRFGIWFAGAQEPSELRALAYVLSQEITEGDTRISPQVQVGAALYPRDGEEAEALLTAAAAALAEAGRSAPAGPAAANAASVIARERFTLAQEARRALQRNELSLKYQPVVDLAHSRVVGCEALLRWTHPHLGAVPPGEFVPMLEQSGQMDEVGLWVLNTACRQARQWRDEGLGELTMAVNLSAVQCRDPQLGDVVMRTLSRHGLKPQQLELELTETAAMEDAETTRQLLTQLRELGVNVALDDFGAGYSSLTYLKNLPFSKLKIDREFVTHVDERRDSQAICSALVALAKGLGIRVLAEGVERREELETLRTLGCPLIQGYYFAKPLEPAQFVSTITDPAWLALAASPVHRQRALIDRRARP